jgi:hypothetical protein
LGPKLEEKRPFSIQVAIHVGMGPGGFLWRWDDDSPWSSMRGPTAWGAERLRWPTQWQIGHGQSDPNSQPFRGNNLQIKGHIQQDTLTFQ